MLDYVIWEANILGKCVENNNRASSENSQRKICIKISQGYKIEFIKIGIDKDYIHFVI